MKGNTMRSILSAMTLFLFFTLMGCVETGKDINAQEVYGKIILRIDGIG